MVRFWNDQCSIIFISSSSSSKHVIFLLTGIMQGQYTLTLKALEWMQ